MKATGIVRKIDDLGRIVIPMELRRTLDIDLKDPIEIFVDEDFILLKKYNPACCICGSMDELVNFNEKKICKNCIGEYKGEEK
ncbi:AbrB/MazE/SpoVT family DNA-binding domain-containing protein [Clostridium aminobutyricum]|uniref:AbrB/MazE/SpoVT family DNA-binding domain-containing protein n=1 Tax=Clostridium aminobutyricum TaxID=33953 RepID=A0A939DAP1_CLOAM|nr:AbrB/MazE/SpoVT family DNA-binding domain-containing protein [Clostridium aminobutyricum]MBN7774332.1 AbrB/MazE/SpoVT family DNA-binding domain-containing protein [Clostridium aminobutyricum]